MLFLKLEDSAFTLRYNALDRCFRNPGRKYFIEDLLEACNKALYEYAGGDVGVKERTIYDDIKFMESDQGWSIPLQRLKEGKGLYQRYEDLDYSINNKSLNHLEANQLKETLLTLSRFKGLPQFKWISEIITRLQSSFNLTDSTESYIEIDQNHFYRIRVHLSPIPTMSTLCFAIFYLEIINF